MLYLLLDLTRTWLDERGLYGLFAVLDQVQFRALIASVLAFVLVVVLGPSVIRRLVRLKIGDAGATDVAALRAHAASKANTPTMGGILICGSILIVTLLLADITRPYVAYAIVLLVWLSAVGGVDDWLKLTSATRGGGRQGLYSWEKLVFQLGIGLVVGFFAYGQGGSTPGLDVAHVVNLPFQRTYLPGGGGLAEGLIELPRWVYVLVCVLMVAGLSNAVNITDGMDGLAAGVSTTVSFGVMLLALIAGSAGVAQYLLVPSIPDAAELGVVAGAMAGACLGFLWWNCAPAKVFMGDTGSLAIGGMLGYIAVVIRQEIIVLFMCAIFLMEIGSVVLQVGYFKLTKGKRIFRCAPYHHHLHIGGWTESQVVARAWILAILVAVFALASLKLR